MRLDPGAHPLATMPTGVVPNQQQGPLIGYKSPGQVPLECSVEPFRGARDDAKTVDRAAVRCLRELRLPEEDLSTQNGLPRSGPGLIVGAGSARDNGVGASRPEGSSLLGQQSLIVGDGLRIAPG